MALTGNVDAFDGLIATAKRLRQVPAQASRAVAVGLHELIEDEFDAGTDPYGTAWEPLAPATVARGRHAPPLTDYGAMRESLNTFALVKGGELSGGVGITIDQPASPHQTGWSGPQGEGPARPILPDRGRLPATWDELIATSVSDAIKETLR